MLGVAGTADVVANSLSPAMFAAAFSAIPDLHGYYVPLAMRERAARKALRGIARMGFHGVNVTMPFKPIAAEVAHSRSAAVERSGVANTLLVTEEGLLHAEATDGLAVIELLAASEIDLPTSTVTLLGAGGAAIDVAWALAGAGVARLQLWNRTIDRARRLAADLQIVHPELVLEVYETLPIHDPARVLVSAVPRDSFDVGAPVPMWHSGLTVVDLAYRPDRQPTPLLRSAAAAGASCIDGRRVLAHQGAAAFRLWFGQDAPIEVMERAVA